VRSVTATLLDLDHRSVHQILDSVCASWELVEDGVISASLGTLVSLILGAMVCSMHGSN